MGTNFKHVLVSLKILVRLDWSSDTYSLGTSHFSLCRGDVQNFCPVYKLNIILFAMYFYLHQNFNLLCYSYPLIISIIDLILVLSETLANISHGILNSLRFTSVL